MKDQNFDEDVTKVLDEAPNARKALMENYDNLLKVAQYCHDNYLESGDSSMAALEETKTFTTQSLASIAYQISTLACSVLSLFDAQTNQLCHMESSINHIGQTVEMHKEKVSRREVGVYTSVRRVPRSHKILPPKPVQPRPLYSRQPINYQQLDGLGHSMKVSGKQSDKTGTIHKHGASIRSNKPPEPVQCPVAPPVISSSFGKPVAPPTIPTTWPAAPEGDIITTLLAEAPPPTPPPPPPTTNEVLSQDVSLPAPASSGDMVSPPPPPPLPPSHSEALTNQSSPSQGPPLTLETVVEENSFPPPSPPPPSDDDSFLLLSNDVSELPTPPPPPAPSQEVDVTLPSRRSRRRSPHATRSLSLRVRSGPASRCHHTRSLFLPATQSLMIPPPPPYPPPCPPPTSSSPSLTLLPCSSSASSPRLCLPARLQHLDLEIPAPPPPLLLDDESGLDDIMPSLPPPVDLDSNAPPHYLDKVVVLYSYEATKPDDLHLTEGEIVYLTHRHDDGWCEGFLNGNKGFFPESYVQLHS